MKYGNEPMNKTLYIINGPNLNLLGQREPEIYGHDTLVDVEVMCRTEADNGALNVTFMQSNSEGEIIGWIHEARQKAAGIIINPGSLSHTSIGILDALNAFVGPVIEVHISNIHRREAFRHHSYVSARADGVIVGCGVQGYVLAVQRMRKLVKL
jgi:3-dehydroquinate dehydratase II